MELHIKNLKDFNNILNAVGIMTDEMRMKFTETGLIIREMDTTKVAMVDIFIPRAKFEKYELSDGEQVICINPIELQKLTRRGKADSKVTLEVKNEKVEVRIFGEYTKHYKLPTLNPSEQKEYTVPNLQYNVQMTLVAETLKDAIEDVGLISNDLIFEVINDKLVLKATDGIRKAELTFTKESNSLLSLLSPQKEKSMYSTTFLMEIFKTCTPFSDVVKISFETNKPIIIDFKTQIADLLRYYLAPKIPEGAE